MSLNHKNLIDLGGLLNYGNLTEGLCAGFSGMWAQSVLVNDEATFLARLDLIERYKENFQELVEKINAVKIKSSKLLPLSEEDEQLLSVLSLYDGISLYLRPHLFSDTFGRMGPVSQTDLNEIFSLTKPNKVDKDIGVILNKPFIFNNDQLEKYLDDLQKVFIGADGQTPVLITFLKHQVALRYDEGKQCWFYLDTNHLGTENFWLELSSKELAQELHKAASGKYSENVLFTTTALSLGPNKELSEKLEQLDLKYQADHSHISMFSNEDDNLFMLACRDGDINLIRKLMSSGFTFNVENGINRALEHACMYGNLDVIRELISYDTKDVLDFDGALFNAVNSNAEVVQELLDNGADEDSYTSNSYSILAKAIDIGNEDVVRLLINNGARDRVDSKYEMNSIMRACRKGTIGIVRKLLKYEYGTGLDLKDINGYTALHFSCEQGDSDIVAMLINAGAKLTHKNKEGYTPLDIAIRDKNDTVISVLLETIINQKLKIEDVVSSKNVEIVKNKLPSQKGMMLAQKLGKVEFNTFQDSISYKLGFQFKFEDKQEKNAFFKAIQESNIPKKEVILNTAKSQVIRVSPSAIDKLNLDDFLKLYDKNKLLPAPVITSESRVEQKILPKRDLELNAKELTKLIKGIKCSPQLDKLKKRLVSIRIEFKDENARLLFYKVLQASGLTDEDILWNGIGALNKQNIELSLEGFSKLNLKQFVTLYSLSSAEAPMDKVSISPEAATQSDIKNTLDINLKNGELISSEPSLNVIVPSSQKVHQPTEAPLSATEPAPSSQKIQQTPEASLNATESAPPFQKVQQPAEAPLNVTKPAPSSQNILQAAIASLVDRLRSTYQYGENGTSRMHFNTVESKGLTKPYLDKTNNNPLRGDALKRAILDEFKEKLEKCTSGNELESCYTEFKDTPEYTILETHQRPQTFKFEKSKTSAIQALEKMYGDAQQLLDPKPVLNKEEELTSHDSMVLK